MSREALLILTQAGKEPRSFSLADEVWLGRGDDCGIQLNDRAISRRHAVIRRVGDGVEVENKSTFGPLRVNGVECSHSVLKEGDLVALGSYQVALSYPKKNPEPVKSSLQRASSDSELFADLEGESSPPRDALPEKEVFASESENLDAAEAGVTEDSSSAQSDSDSNQADSGVSQDFGLQMDVADSGEAPESTAQDPAQEAPGVEAPMSFDDESSDRTKIAPMAQVVAKLIFRPGDSNREEYLVERDEITIGRSPDCQIVLSDKKASRKNTLIRRAGLQFSIKDLDSVNGTILNGITVTNAELTGDDVIQIGDTQFSFKVSNSEYHNNKNSFDSVSEVSEESSLLSPDIGGLSSDLSPGVFGSGGVHDSRGPDLASDGLSKLNGVLGLDSNKSQDRTPLQKLQDLPPKTWLYIAVVVGFAYMSRDDIMGFLQVQPQRPAVKASQKNVTAKPSGTPFNLSFEKLPLDKRNFVESQQNLGFEYYKSGDYDKAIFELEKIFTIVSDYKDSRDILRYAKEGKKKQESIAEEKRKKEQEQQLKEKISSLVDDARLMMREKKYDSARELFTEIMAIDPDNSSVIEWKKVLEQVDEQRRVQNQLLQVRREINAEGWRIYRQALANGRSEKYVSAIEILKRVLSTGVTEIKLKSAVAASIKEYNDQIAKLREPAFKEGQRLEASNDLGGAFKQFKKSTEIDPKFKEGYEAMSRIRGTLHDRAKTVYTEAIIAENYSDFETAEKLYKTCESLAPVDDVYHDRAVRKLSKFVSLHALKEMEAANSSTEQPSQPSVEASPGQTPLQTSGQDQAPGNPSQDSGTPGPTVSQEGVGEDPK